jgi:hypothetical protein
MKSENWFEVSKAGLSQAFGENGFTSLMFELIQNSWDANAAKVDVGVEFKGRRAAFYVADDGCGIADLAAIYTVFGQSTSKDNPEKRGRFCIGDKLLLARCEDATVTSKTGTVIFEEFGRRNTNLKREQGTIISGTIRCTRAEFDQFEKDVQTLLVPLASLLTVNGKCIMNKQSVINFTADLPTIIVNEDQELKRVSRSTNVHLYEADGQAYIYEMGIPVCEANCPYHIDIGQKVPLSMDRTKLPESFLKTLHALVLNRTADKLNEDQIKAAWVAQATSSKHIEPAAMKTFMDKRFGEDRVAFDPSDKESNNRAVAKSFTVVTGGALSGEQWENAKRFELVKPAGQVFPTPKPFNPDGSPLKVIAEADYTAEQNSMAATAKWLASNLIDKRIVVMLTDDKGWHFGGAYGPDGILYISVVSHPQRGERWLNMIVHEFGHEYSGNHLADEFHDALTRIAAKLAKLVLNNHERFRDWLK